MNEKQKKFRYTEPKGEGIRQICFEDPITGRISHPKKSYRAERWETLDGVKARKEKCFELHREAKDWRVDGAIEKTTPAEAKQFRALFDHYVEKELSQQAPATQRTRRAQSRHLKFFMRPSVRMDALTPEFIDQWLIRVRDDRYLRLQHSTRRSYRLEWKLLGQLLNYYAETFWHEAREIRFASPLLKRHRKKLVVKVVPKAEKKDLTIEAYHRWIGAISAQVDRSMDRIWAAKNDRALAGFLQEWQVARRVQVIAQLQYPLVGRGQDIPALNREDFNLETKEVTLKRRVVWLRDAGAEALVVDGLKNDQLKVIYSPLACKIAEEWWLGEGIKSGPLFYYQGKPLSYRQLQYRYDFAFREAGLEKSGMHVVRHGSGTEVHRAAGGDMKQAQTALGHQSLKTTEGYVGVRGEDFRKALTTMDERLQQVIQ